MESKARLLCLASAVCLVVSGCQNMGGDAASAACNPGYGALIGGALGAAIGDNDRTKGALIGAGVGALACMVINSYSAQTKTAQQAEDEYKSQNKGKLPTAEPVVQNYDVNIANGGQVRAGEKVQVVSNMTVVQGAQPVNEVKEVLTLAGPTGTKTAEKKANERPGSGGYQNTFNLSFPADVSPGEYPITTQLYVNGKQVGERRQQLQIVATDNGPRFTIVSL
jgi:YMGG-like Gly-zipper